MKNNILSIGVLSIILIVGIFAQSCEKAKDWVAFDVALDMPDQHFDIDSASTVKGEIILYESYLEINLDSVLEANSVEKSKLENSRFKDITLKIDNPTPKMELGFVSTLTLRIYTTKDYTDGKVIATAKGIKNGDVSVNFTMNNENLDSYFELSKFYYRLYGTLESQLAVKSMPIILSSNIKFTVKPLK